jgi:hypothetical protein
MRSLRELTGLCAAVFLAACGNASPDLNGGGALAPDPCAAGGANGGSGWSDLYACYFGPTGKASCGSQFQCHSATDTQAGVYFVCGPDQDACWMSMTQGMVKLTVGTPTETILYQSLRPAGGPLAGKPLQQNMPLNSSFGFTPDDLARIATWLSQGAPNN